MIFVGKARIYSRVEHLKGVSIWWALALLENIQLGWKDLLWTNPLAYYNDLNYGFKKAYNIGPRRVGPRLPFDIYGASMVEDPRGAIVLIGGFDGKSLKY
jgi:hypothetical protein